MTYSLPPLFCLYRWPRNQQSSTANTARFKYAVLILTFFNYLSYHMSRKPLSVVKGQLHHNCSKDPSNTTHKNDSTWCDFAPFDQDNYKSLYGELDYAFLIAYAVGMFISGIIAERMSLRYFLAVGMILSGIFTVMFGIGFYAQIHSFTFYIVAQVLNGLVQTTGWPGVVTCVGNWFGKSKRGLIMGIWNSHTSFGNIIGSAIAAAFVSSAWGLSFIIPGCIIASFGIITFLVLVESPDDIGVGNEIHDSNQNDGERDDDSRPLLEDASESLYNGGMSGSKPVSHHKAVSFWQALQIPGVLEFSLSLFFAKLVAYTFLFWLPFYIQNTASYDAKVSGLLSTLFDFGGIAGGIIAGLVSDKTGRSATTCAGMLLIACGMMYIYYLKAKVSLTVNIVLLLITGAFVNGPYSLITTAVSADLGTHSILKNNAKALSTVTAIIDGVGSIGAAFGPYLTGIISPTGWQNVFYMLIGANLLSTVFLLRLVWKDLSSACASGRSEDFDDDESLFPGTSEA